VGWPAQSCGRLWAQSYGNYGPIGAIEAMGYGAVELWEAIGYGAGADRGLWSHEAMGLYGGSC
jgi:hypothetical protein